MAQPRSADGSYHFVGCIACFQPRDTTVKPEPSSKKRKQPPWFAAAAESKKHTKLPKELDNGSGDVEAASAPAPASAHVPYEEGEDDEDKEESEEQEKEKNEDGGGAECVETNGIPIVSFLPAPSASS